METRKVSLYAILQSMGHNPYFSHSQWASKIDGKKSITIDQLQMLLEIISNLSPDLPKLKVEDIPFNPERVIIK